jgi:hypothetical protein
MKLTKETLKRIIKEELSEVMREAKYGNRETHDRYDDASNHIGERMFFHTDRTTRGAGKNGMIGSYTLSGSGSPKKSSWKTNAVILDDVVFYVNLAAAKRTAKTDHRTVHAGAVGTVSPDNKSESWTLTADRSKGPFAYPLIRNTANFSKGDVQIQYDPKIAHFFVKGDPTNKITRADKVYFQATEADSYLITAINPR